MNAAQPTSSKDNVLLRDCSSAKANRDVSSDLTMGHKSVNFELGDDINSPGKVLQYQSSSATNSPPATRRMPYRAPQPIVKGRSVEREDLSSTQKPPSYISNRSQTHSHMLESSSTSHLTASPSVSSERRTKFGSRKGTLTSAGSMPSLRILPNQGAGNRKAPDPVEGYILKGRKWPLKGYHKRYFRLAAGSLIYAKTPSNLSKGKISARVDLANTFVTLEKAKLNIEIDASIIVYHLKFDTQEEFQKWQRAISEHRQFDQYQSAFTATTPSETKQDGEVDLSENCTISPGHLSSHHLLNNQAALPAPGQEFASQQASPVSKHPPAPLVLLAPVRRRERISQEQAMKSLLQAFQSLKKDYDTFREAQDSLAKIAATRNLSATSPTRSEFFSPMSTLLSPVSFVHEQQQQQQQQQSGPAERGHMRKASSMSSFASACTIVQRDSTMDSEVLGRLPVALLDTNAAASAFCDSAECFLKEATAVLERLHQLPPDFTPRQSNGARRPKSSIEGMSLPQNEVQPNEGDFVFDNNISGGMAERVDSETETESDNGKTEGDSMADNSSLVDAPFELPPTTEPSRETSKEAEHGAIQRRTKLPAPQPDISRFSLLSLLRSNIGRDLTRVRLPVILNEPLSALQVMCEEMEYSELLDTACTKTEPAERMIYIAAYAVSGYARTKMRAATKPFNPLLGETFECIRPEKHWRFMAEQVCHHPPVAASHCSSSDWTLNQEIIMKNKFWGRSLEIVPMGGCEVHLNRWNETYTWNKVTTCITGLFSPADRALEHYGDMIIKCNTGEVCTVKFHKPEAKRPDSFRAISGVVLSTGHEVGSNWTLFGKWDEYLICRNSNNENNCIWKPTPLPSNAAEYYGLTAFAITLNEPVPRAEVDLGRVPITDCRLRPDQRLLEEGRIEEAEIEKSRLEDDQRRRMKLQTFGVNNSSNPKEAIWNSRWFIQTSNPAQQDETRPSFKFNEKYWSIREQCGFKQLDLPTLW